MKAEALAFAEKMKQKEAFAEAVRLAKEKRD